MVAPPKAIGITWSYCRSKLLLHCAHLPVTLQDRPAHLARDGLTPAPHLRSLAFLYIKQQQPGPAVVPSVVDGP